MTAVTSTVRKIALFHPDEIIYYQLSRLLEGNGQWFTPIPHPMDGSWEQYFQGDFTALIFEYEELSRLSLLPGLMEMWAKNPQVKLIATGLDHREVQAEDEDIYFISQTGPADLFTRGSPDRSKLMYLLTADQDGETTKQTIRHLTPFTDRAGRNVRIQEGGNIRRSVRLGQMVYSRADEEDRQAGIIHGTPGMVIGIDEPYAVSCQLDFALKVWYAGAKTVMAKRLTEIDI